MSAALLCAACGCWPGLSIVESCWPGSSEQAALSRGALAVNTWLLSCKQQQQQKSRKKGKGVIVQLELELCTFPFLSPRWCLLLRFSTDSTIFNEGSHHRINSWEHLEVKTKRGMLIGQQEKPKTHVLQRLGLLIALQVLSLFISSLCEVKSCLGGE